MDNFIGNTPADGLCNPPDPHIIHNLQIFCQFLLGKICEIIGHQTVHMLFQRTDGFHKSTFKVIANAHHFTGSLHLCGQSSLGADKFIERQTWYFYNTIVQHRLKAGISLTCDGIRDLIQGIAQSNLGCHLGNRIACSFRCQG